MSDKPKFRLESASNGRTQVVENSTNLIWRTLPSRAEAASWLDEADPAPADRIKKR